MAGVPEGACQQCCDDPLNPGEQSVQDLEPDVVRVVFPAAGQGGGDP